MDEAFRQKLLNWFISILLLLSAASVMFLISWFARAPSVTETPYMTRGAEIAVSFGGVTVIFAILFFPVVIWHLLDFTERLNDGQQGRIVRFFSSHTVLVLTMGISQIAGILIATGIADWNSCDDLPPGSFPYSCQIGLEWWANLLFFGPLLFAFILCIGKAAITIRSRLKLSK